MRYPKALVLFAAAAAAVPIHGTSPTAGEIQNVTRSVTDHIADGIFGLLPGLGEQQQHENAIESAEEEARNQAEAEEKARAIAEMDAKLKAMQGHVQLEEQRKQLEAEREQAEARKQALDRALQKTKAQERQRAAEAARKKKAEDDARKKAEEAARKKKAEEDARKKKAEDEARRIEALRELDSYARYGGFGCC